MGWKLKTAAFLFALLALGAGALIIALPLLLYVFLPWILARRRRDGGDGGTPSAGGHRWLAYLGVFFLAVSLVALASGGVFSVLVFGGLGAGLVYLGAAQGSGLPASLVPVSESILMKDRLLPFRWSSVVEVKCASGGLTRLLPALNGRFVVTLREKTGVFLLLQATALTEAEAERKLVGRIRELSKSLVAIGAYLFPVEAREASPMVSHSCERVTLDLGNLDHSLSTQTFDSLAVSPRGHVVAALGAYQSDEGGHSRVTAAANQALKKPVLVWEVAKALEKRVREGRPDDVTVFLSSLAATRGADIGERIVQVESDSTATVMVRSLGTPEVELSRAQLRALVRAYS